MTATIRRARPASATRRRSRAVALGAVAFGALALLAVLLLGGGDDRRPVRAEFDTARGVIPRNFVRFNGIRAGEITDVELTDRGTALVTMRVERWVPAPRADATAVVRPADLFGDVYVAIDPGRARAALAGTIPVARTANVGRLDDLLRVFRQPARAGLRSMLVELGVALERHGGDLNRELLRVRPTFAAARAVMTQLASERASLRRLIGDSEAVMTQVRDRTRAVGGMLDSFSGLLRSTAAHAAGLERGIAGLPPALGQLDATTGELARTSAAAAPLAAALRDAAPGLSTAFARLEPFLARTRSVVGVARPTLRRAADFLARGGPSLRELAGGVGRLAAGGEDLRALTQTLVQAAPQLGEALLVATAGQALEPGNQPFDPTTNPLRRYWRGAAVLSCETFGRRVEPGCLSSYLAHTAPAGRERRSGRTRPAQRVTDRVKERVDGARKAADGLAGKVRNGVDRARDEVDKALQRAGKTVDDALGTGGSTRQLLDFLLAP